MEVETFPSSPYPTSPGMRGDGKFCRRILSSLSLLGFPFRPAAFDCCLRALFSAHPNAISTGPHAVGPRCFYRSGGCPATVSVWSFSRSGSRWAQRCPDFWFRRSAPTRWSLICVVGIRGLEVCRRPAGPETNPTRTVVTYAQSACWPGVSSRLGNSRRSPGANASGFCRLVRE